MKGKLVDEGESNSVWRGNLRRIYQNDMIENAACRNFGILKFWIYRKKREYYEDIEKRSDHDWGWYLW